MSHRYRYCGLTLASDLALPELPRVALETSAEQEQEPDLRISIGPVPEQLPDERRRTATFAHNGREALWWLDGIGRFQVSAGGCEIRVQPAPAATVHGDDGGDNVADAQPNAVVAAEAALRLMLLDPVLRLASVLRGDWMINAAAVEKDGLVHAFIGPSASGKSTAAALLLQRGFRLVSDSLLRLTPGPDGGYLAHPQAPWLQLWPDSRRQLGLEDTEATPVRPDLALRRLSWPLLQEPLPLARIGLLREQRGNDLDAFVPSQRGGRLGVETLLTHTAGSTWLDDLADRRALFHWAVGLKARTPLQRLDLPWGWDRRSALAEQLARWCRSPAP